MKMLDRCFILWFLQMQNWYVNNNRFSGKIHIKNGRLTFLSAIEWCPMKI